MNNTNDSVAVTVEYKASPASVSDNLTSSVSMSEVYPNPAISTANIDYSLPSGANRAEIVLTNMLGCRVGQVTLPETSGKTGKFIVKK